MVHENGRTPENTQTARTTRIRLILLRVGIILVFSLLLARLWQIQFMEGSQYQLQADGNRFKVESIPAPRGVIYDRFGRVLVRNEPTFNVDIVPAGVPEDEEEHVLTTLAGLLDLPLTNQQALARASRVGSTEAPEAINSDCGEPGLLECFERAAAVAPYRPIRVGDSIARETAFKLREQSFFLPGVSVKTRAQREYLFGPLLSHIIGYVAPVTEEFLNSASSSEAYVLDDHAGAAGVEKSMERELRGESGQKLVEKNVFGREVRVLEEHPPEPGNNLFLTLDLNLQRVATEALRKGLEEVGSPRGAVVALDPRNGQVLSLVSLPSYDNNLFIGGIKEQEYQALLNDDSRPLLNMAVSAYGFPPGSIFKMVTASAVLQEGVISVDRRLPAPGIIYLPNKYYPDNEELAQPFYDWLESGHGNINIVDAIARSSDVYFYKVAGGFKDEVSPGLGEERLAQWSEMYGLGQPTRIDLPSESSGLVPTRQWKRLTWSESWVTGDTYNMAIGQGYLTTTPLQMANVTAAVANGGTLYRPQLVYQVQDPNGTVVNGFQPDVLRHVPADPQVLATVREGMRGAVARSDGTARYAGLPTSVEIAGKTGTAEYCDYIPEQQECKRDEEGNLATHAWFTAFAPYDTPELAIVVFVHGNGKDVIEGSRVAAPIAADILRYWFEVRPTQEEGMLVTPTVITDSIESATATPVATTEAAPPSTPIPSSPAEQQPSGGYTGAVVRTESQPATLSVVTGRVVDATGQGVSGVEIKIDGGGPAVATLTTGPDGTFRYDLLNSETASQWNVRATNLPNTPVISLNVEPQKQYVVRFAQ